MFKGSFVALVTPFKDGAVDEAALEALVEWHIAEGTHGLVPVGTTGESPTLTHTEHERVIEIVVNKAAKRVPVIAGAGSNNTAEAIRFVQYAERVDAAILERGDKGDKRTFEHDDLSGLCGVGRAARTYPQNARFARARNPATGPAPSQFPAGPPHGNFTKSFDTRRKSYARIAEK